MLSKIKLALILTVGFGLTSCYTTRFDLGSEPTGDMEKDKFNAALIGGTGPVDITKHCNGGNVANVQIKKAFFDEDVTFACAGGKMAKAEPRMQDSKRKRKMRKQRRRKKAM